MWQPVFFTDLQPNLRLYDVNLGIKDLTIVTGKIILMSPLRKPLFITNGCKIQYLRQLKKSFLNVAMATPPECFHFFLDLEFFAHFHAQKGFRSGLIDNFSRVIPFYPIKQTSCSELLFSVPYKCYICF
ncbi:MAG: hypothetical protein EA411_03135 [Saprospirales bacterium]|nr:MAG: hypothetical protein EA411_03135 [Saprospirales bacterium]